MIPSHVQRFSRSSKPKLQGVAYVEFGSLADVEEAVSKLNGTLFKNRALRVRVHVPYKPRADEQPLQEETREAVEKVSEKPENEKEKENEKENEKGNDNKTQDEEAVLDKTAIAEAVAEGPELETETANTKEGDSNKVPDPMREPKELSTNTLFLKRVNVKVSKAEIAEALHGYEVVHVSTPKSGFGRRGSFSFRSRFANKLVVLNTGGQPVEEIVHELRARPMKLRNEVVDVLVSYAQRAARKPTPLNVANKAAATQALLGAEEEPVSPDEALENGTTLAAEAPAEASLSPGFATEVTALEEVAPLA